MTHEELWESLNWYDMVCWLCKRVMNKNNTIGKVFEDGDMLCQECTKKYEDKINGR